VNPSHFFDEGLQFECTECGACCTGAPGQVLVSSAEIDGLARSRDLTREAFIAAYCRETDSGLSLVERPNGDCVFFAGNRCTVYAHRPRQCRTYPFWFKNLRSPERWAQVAKECPGIGRGRRYSRDEILALLHEDMERPTSGLA
jgi:Fe-S-cluster containining protein